MAFYCHYRGFSSDVFITDVSSLLLRPTVTELLNLFAHPAVLPDAVVAPSTFALQHLSVQNLRKEVLRVMGRALVTAVISPGVDVNQFFNRVRYRQEEHMQQLEDLMGGRRRLQTVGFVGRLAPGALLFSGYHYYLLRRSLLLYCRHDIITTNDCSASILLVHISYLINLESKFVSIGTAVCN